MIDLDQVRWASWGVLAAAPLAVFALLFVRAPYGRHTSTSWGPRVPGRLGWVLMESPTVVLFLPVFFAGTGHADPVALALLGLWMFHYVHRTFVFPFRLRTTKPMPVLIVALSLVFQSLNSAANAAWIGGLGGYDTSWLLDPRFGLGVALFAAGEGINLHADTVLIGLRKPGESGYTIPVGGLFRWVTCPNYLGELLAWTGWAVATWSLPGLAFAVFTAANLAPRAMHNHAWYRETFPDYPPERRALIPWLL